MQYGESVQAFPPPPGEVKTRSDCIVALAVFARAGLQWGRNIESHPVTQECIRKVFGKFGEITHIKTGQRDFIFIDYRDMESCKRAIEAMNNQPFDEHSKGNITVKWADEDKIRQGGGYRRDDRRDDRFRDDFRRRSRSPVGRGGGGGGYSGDARARDRDDYARPRSRSPRGDRRDGHDLPPPPGNLPYRGRSRERERMPDARAPGAWDGSARDDMGQRGDRGDARRDYYEPRRDVDPRRDVRPPQDDGYGRAGMSDSRDGHHYPPRLDGREREKFDGGVRGPAGRGGAEYGDARYGDARDARYERRQGEAHYPPKGAEYDPRREEARYPPARDDVRRDHEYPKRSGYDTRPGFYDRPPDAGGDGRAGGGYRGEAPYDASAPGTGRAGHDRGYSPPRRERSRSADRNRAGPCAAIGPPPDRNPVAYDDRGGNRAVNKDYDRAPPRRNEDFMPRSPRRNEDYYASQQREPDAGRGRRDYTHEYPPPRAGAEAGYPRRDEYPRRDDGRASEGHRDYESARVDDRGVDARKYAGGRGDYRGEYADKGRADSHTYAADVDRSQQASYPYENHDVWPRTGVARTSDPHWDRRGASPPREARGADAGDARNFSQAYGDAFANQPGAIGEEGVRDAGSAGAGVREMDSLPPNDLRKSLVRDASVSSGSCAGSQAGGAGSAPAQAAAGHAGQEGEIISDVEAQRRRQRAERFSAGLASQVCCVCMGVGEGRVLGREVSGLGWCAHVVLVISMV